MPWLFRIAANSEWRIASSLIVILAYRDVGMRVSYSYAVRDQNRLVYQQDEDFIAGLSSELRGPMRRWFGVFN
jgi:hypothetical protein